MMSIEAVIADGGVIVNCYNFVAKLNKPVCDVASYEAVRSCD
jgi:hypothetical protein